MSNLNQKLGEHIRALRKKEHLTGNQLGERIGASGEAIYKLERGERRISMLWIERLAEGLQIRPAEILAGAAMTAQSVMMRGRGKIDLWRDDPFLPESEQYPVPVPDDPRYAERFAFLVGCEGINLIYPKGTILFCTAECEFDEIGKYYLFTRTRKSDGKIEILVHRMIKDQAGQLWLKPESSEPKFKAIKLASDQDYEIEIIARVVGSYKAE